MKLISVIGILLSLQFNNVHALEKVEATIDWAHRVDLLIPVDGIVKKINVTTGQTVKKGTALVELDSRTFRADLSQAKARAKSLKETYDEANRELSRALELYDRTVLSDHDLQVAKNHEVVAKANLEQAKAELVKAKIHLELASLSAPFDSIILKRNVEVGQAIINKFSYAPLITLASNSRYYAKSTISQAQTEVVNIGKKVHVVVNGKRYDGKAVAIEYSLDNNTAQSQLVVEFESTDKRIHAGLKATVEF